MLVAQLRAGLSLILLLLPLVNIITGEYRSSEALAGKTPSGPAVPSAAPTPLELPPAAGDKELKTDHLAAPAETPAG